MNGEASTVGWLSFLSFAFSVFAAVLAIDMYKLLRTGDFGKTWRLLIIASVMFVLLQVLRLAELFNFRAMREYHLSEIVELCFVMILAFAFYQQRNVFAHEHKIHRSQELEIEELENSQHAVDGDEFDDDAPNTDDLEDDETGIKPPAQWPQISHVEARTTLR